jgi:Cu2+-exporting ATPase
MEGAPESGIEDEPGRGAACTDDAGRRWTLGRGGWAGDAADGATSLCCDGRRVAAFRFRDTLRPDTARTLEMLRRRGCELWILSGDAPAKVAELAGQLGISAARAFGGLDPAAKAEKVRAIDRGDTLYLGDGANDSLAFDVATVTGTPVVDRSLLEAKADFFTLGSGLDFLPALFRAADARARGVRAAFAFALIYNTAAVGICLAGHMDPLLAAILMPLSSIFSIILVAGRRQCLDTSRALL